MQPVNEKPVKFGHIYLTLPTRGLLKIFEHPFIGWHYFRAPNLGIQD